MFSKAFLFIENCLEETQCILYLVILNSLYLMKKLFLIAIVFLYARTGKAQQLPFDLRFNSTQVQGSTGQTELKATGYILNTSGAKSTFNWRIYKNNRPSTWKVTISDETNNYNENITDGSVEIDNNDSAVFNIHINPQMIGGKAVITVDVANEIDPFDLVSLDVSFDAWSLNISNPETTPTVTFWPNPTTESLNFNIPRQQPVSIEIYNVVGQLQLSQTITNENPTISVNHLNPGLYYIRYADTNGNLLSLPFNKT